MRWQTRARSLRLRSMTRAALFAIAAAIASPAAAQTLPAGLTTPVADDVAALRDAALKDDVAWDIVEGLTTEIGPRLAGTEAEARARASAAAKPKALGFQHVRSETYQTHVWVRGAGRADVGSPFTQPLRLTAPAP